MYTLYERDGVLGAVTASKIRNLGGSALGIPFRFVIIVKYVYR
jgi:hypothetical protein